jgi:hypothetical protein
MNATPSITKTGTTDSTKDNSGSDLKVPVIKTVRQSSTGSNSSMAKTYTISLKRLLSKS